LAYPATATSTTTIVEEDLGEPTYIGED
jgi:hypothetical protein